MLPRLVPTLADVAREAQVSLATVDRALNGRGGVHSRTMTRIEEAVARLGFRPDPAASRLARRTSYRFCVLLPTGSNSFMEGLLAALQATRGWLDERRTSMEIRRVDVFDPLALAAALEELGELFHGVGVVALDHPRVRAAIDELRDRGVAVVTLVSDVPNSGRNHFVGIDNLAAGRTAGSMAGRFVGGRPGRVGLLAGAVTLRDHAERVLGFNQVIASEFPGLRVEPPLETGDDRERAHAAAARLLAAHPDLVALYNVGAGNEGVGRALAEAGRAGQVVFIGHELTAVSRRLLLQGVMDAVINQDPGHEARSMVRLLHAAVGAEAVIPDQERIRIDIYIRDNIP